MNLKLLAATSVISTVCSAALVVISALSVKEQAKLNETIAKGTADISAANNQMLEFINSIK